MPKRKTAGTRIELKKLTIYERMSEETTAFSAEIYIDGINAGQAKNDGHGGSTDYYAYPEHRKLIEEAERECLALPPMKCGGGDSGMREFEVPMNLENYIDGIVEDEMRKKDKKKFEKQIEKKMPNHIMWGVPNGDTYTSMKFKQNFAPAHAVQLQKYIDEKVKPQLKAGEVILNTNLQVLGITI